MEGGGLARSYLFVFIPRICRYSFVRASIFSRCEKMHRDTTREATFPTNPIFGRSATKSESFPRRSCAMRTIPARDSIGSARARAFKCFKEERARARLNLSIPGTGMHGTGDDTGMRERRTRRNADALGASFLPWRRQVKDRKLRILQIPSLPAWKLARNRFPITRRSSRVFECRKTPGPPSKRRPGLPPD